ncbi:hypothetical protein [Gracilibacillus sp. JCM 18860]|uniref:hypothetical protein n=1 Tax=Gracilibacillus sp. JCM 18860 TaxID=1306159 RepID=UPI0006CFCC5D
MKKCNQDFVVQRINDFGTKFERRFVTKQGLEECLKDYKTNNVIDDYEIETSDDLWKFVIDTLGKGD